MILAVSALLGSWLCVSMHRPPSGVEYVFRPHTAVHWPIGFKQGRSTDSYRVSGNYLYIRGIDPCCTEEGRFIITFHGRDSMTLIDDGWLHEGNYIASSPDTNSDTNCKRLK